MIQKEVQILGNPRYFFRGFAISSATSVQGNSVVNIPMHKPRRTNDGTFPKTLLDDVVVIKRV